jgi:nucleotide-binding universal stress UspA family protein
MILVGVDGSKAGLEAAGWAAREAALRSATLRVVHSMPRWALEMPEDARYADVGRWMRGEAEAVVSVALERVRAVEPEVAVASAVLPGDPRQVLIAMAWDAELLVVGSHGLGGFRGLLVGSVALGVAGHAPCEVVVVRESSLPGGPVAVGVDCSASSDAVIGFAIREAAVRGARLRAVHATKGMALFPGMSEESGARALAELMAGWRERYPAVEVTEEVVHGHPVETLREVSGGADLLVVGSHGRGEFAGLILGSVSQAMLYHAICPMAVVRSGSKHA